MWFRTIHSRSIHPIPHLLNTPVRNHGGIFGMGWFGGIPWANHGRWDDEGTMGMWSRDAMGINLNPIGSMVLVYMLTFTINIPQMLAYIPYMDPMGYVVASFFSHEFPTLLQLHMRCPRTETLLMCVCVCSRYSSTHVKSFQPGTKWEQSLELPLIFWFGSRFKPYRY